MNWFEKLLNKMGVLANEKDSEVYSKIDQELDALLKERKELESKYHKVKSNG